MSARRRSLEGEADFSLPLGRSRQTFGSLSTHRLDETGACREEPIMIRLLWTASVEVRYFLRRYMPSNIVLDLLRTRQGLKWGLPAMLLAVPYVAVAHWCTTIIGDGGPGWLHLVVLVCLWSSFKMVLFGPVSVVLLVKARARERQSRRKPRLASYAEA